MFVESDILLFIPLNIFELHFEPFESVYKMDKKTLRLCVVDKLCVSLALKDAPTCY